MSTKEQIVENAAEGIKDPDVKAEAEVARASTIPDGKSYDKRAVDDYLALVREVENTARKIERAKQDVESAEQAHEAAKQALAQADKPEGA